MKQISVNRKLAACIADKLDYSFMLFFEAISLLIIVYFSVNIVFSAESTARDNNYAGMQNMDVSLSDISQGSLLYKTDTVGRYIPAPIISTDVEIKITGMLVRAKVTQKFKNTTPNWLEAIYVFPLPEDSAVDHLKMFIGERIIVGKIKPREEAKNIYKKAKREGRKVSLIEQHRPNLFQNSIANIGPNETIKVVIEYQQTLQYQVSKVDYKSNSEHKLSEKDYAGEFNLRFPLAINPRYIPGNAVRKIKTEKIEMPVDNQTGIGWAMNTDKVPDASFITPHVYSSGTPSSKLNKVSLRIELNAGFPIELIESAYHSVSKVRHGEGIYTITLLPDNEHDSDNNADRDFNLKWQTAIGRSPRASVFSERKSDSFYHLLMIMPPTKFDKSTEKLAREVIYIIDTSGSMGGASIRQARKALLLAIERLTAKETFNIIEFNSMAVKLFNTSVSANYQNKLVAQRFIKALQANGGTEMASALNLALNNQGRNPDISGKYFKRIRQVIFLTDGSVGNEDNLFELIKRKLGDSRLFTVGIGSAPNSYFMTKAAKFGRGTFTYIGDVNEVQKKMDELFRKLDSPVLKNIKIKYNSNNTVEVWPKQQPDLYLGEPIIIAAKSIDKLQNIKISADLNNRQWILNLNVKNTNKSDNIAVLWARKKIGYLMDSWHEGRSKQEIKEFVTKIALEHHLVSKYTSLVAVDVSPSRVMNTSLKKIPLKTNLPAGMRYKKVFQPLAKTATTAELDFIKGSILLLIALLMLLHQKRRQYVVNSHSNNAPPKV